MLSNNAILILLEVCFYALAIAIACFFPHARPGWLRQASARFNRFANRRMLSVLAVMIFVLMTRGLLTLVLPTPVPGVNDEFSYILAGDTFASGRLTNPSHPLWKSFETFYVLQTPTYASMYPPAQGMAIALGDKLTGRPWSGVLLSVAFMCGAVCWMLQGWVTPRWALLGGLLLALRLGIYSYWSESYWGGAVAALGGALALGALPRILKKRPRPSSLVAASVTLGIGLLILANSRPFEGLLVALPVLGYLLIHLFRNRGQFGLFPLLGRVVLPLALVLSLGAASMAYYFAKVTGHPLLMPYQLHSTQYELTGPFLWQPIRKSPPFRYAVMRQFQERQPAAYYRAHTLSGFWGESWRKAETLLIFYFWPAMLPALMALPFLRREAKVRFALITVAILFIGLCLEIWPMTLHYHAPITAIMIFLLIQVIRFWRTVQWRGRPVGLAISRAIPLLCAAMLVLRVGAAALHLPVPEHGLAPWLTVAPGNLYRDKVDKYLEAQPGLQLALVRYNYGHHVDEEWVHNAADIDGSKIVWARYGDAAQNEKLLQYFKQRRAWLVDVDAQEGRIMPLPPSASTDLTKQISK